MMNEVIGLGPFIGSFEKEISVFRPYVRYIYNNNKKHKKFYVSCYSRRRFLYNWLENSNIIDVELDDDSYNQIGCINKKISSFYYNNVLIKDFKNKIQELCNCKKRDINIFKIKYKQNFDISTKEYTQIFPIIDISSKYISKCKDKIVLILDNYTDYRKMYDLIEYCMDKEGICIGDSNCSNQGFNFLYSFSNFYDNFYQYFVFCILVSKCVLCAAGPWTFFCNYHRIPVFSWGDIIGPYKDGGTLNFGNNCYALWQDININTNIIKKHIEIFLENLC